MREEASRWRATHSSSTGANLLKSASARAVTPAGPHAGAVPSHAKWLIMQQTHSHDCRGSWPLLPVLGEHACSEAAIKPLLPAHLVAHRLELGLALGNPLGQLGGSQVVPAVCSRWAWLQALLISCRALAHAQACCKMHYRRASRMTARWCGSNDSSEPSSFCSTRPRSGLVCLSYRMPAWQVHCASASSMAIGMDGGWTTCTPHQPASPSGRPWRLLRRPAS